MDQGRIATTLDLDFLVNPKPVETLIPYPVGSGIDPQSIPTGFVSLGGPVAALPGTGEGSAAVAESIGFALVLAGTLSILTGAYLYRRRGFTLR